MASEATGPTVTVIVAVPVMLPLVAVIVTVPGVAAAVYTPVALIVPPPVTDHVGESGTSLPSASKPAAAICNWLSGKTAVLGDTPMTVSVPGAVGPCTSQLPLTSAAYARVRNRRTADADGRRAVTPRRRRRVVLVGIGPTLVEMALAPGARGRAHEASQISIQPAW